ncbi:MAG: hypothetical protein AAFX06_25065 [Planctomycetota bacterium]
MTINYLADVKPLEDAGQSDAEIAAALGAITHRHVDLGDLLPLLNNRGMLSHRHKEDATGSKWSGSIKNMFDAVDVVGSPAEQTAVMQWFSHITNDRNNKFSLNDPQYAAPFAVIDALFADQPGMPTSADFDAVRALGGGLKYRDIDAATIAASRQEHADEVAEQSRMRDIDALRARIENDFINPAMDGSSTAADVQAAIKAGL